MHDSYNKIIGETTTRRAKQLVNQQKAAWADSDQTAIRFYAGMDDIVENEVNIISAEDIQVHQLYFANWKSTGHYYPVVILEDLGEQVKVNFLDGHLDVVPRGHIVEIEEVLDNMELQGKWRDGLVYYKGVLVSREPMVMHYNDGDVEQVRINQLRGQVPKN